MCCFSAEWFPQPRAAGLHDLFFRRLWFKRAGMFALRGPDGLPPCADHTSSHVHQHFGLAPLLPWLYTRFSVQAESSDIVSQV
jgi:hypothetical protein